MFPCVWANAQGEFLAGGAKGLYRITPYAQDVLLSGVSVSKIIAAGENWFLLTSRGVMTSRDLRTFAHVGEQLPKKVVKKIVDREKVFVSQPQPLKDLEVHPDNGAVLVTATNDAVFLSKNGGRTWQNLGCNANSSGIKAVAVLDFPDETGKPVLTVFVSHSLRGIAWMQPEKGRFWTDISATLALGPEATEEISDIAVRRSVYGNELFASYTFVPKIVRLNWAKKRFQDVRVWTAALKDARCIDGLSASVASLVGCRDGSLFEIPLIMPRPFDLARLEQDLRRIPDQILCAWVPRHVSQTGDALSLSELWLLHDRSSLAKEGRFARADLKKGIYVPAHHIKDPKLRAMHFKTIADNKLNMLVYDMKDELGMVRYQSQDPFVRSVGAVRPFVDMKTFVKQAKEKKLYLIARIVVFKDKYLFRWNGFELAVKAGGKPWQGYKNGALRKEEIHEHWVDPYNEKVWRYNVAIAKEAIEFGFDEVQFDYIRFPTDGDNLHQAEYPARESGMDRESALMSFLAYARERIDAPISIDIYGANGWYRTGARTGQDVELLAEYVDVICPMFYPSHFSQSFLAYAPAQERPYRIYYYGAYRNRVLARNRVVIRPWVQAFYLPVSYDRAYYGEDYVQRQVAGIRESIDEGYTYWNNSGRYSDVRPDGARLR